MSRYHDAFEDLAERGHPVGSEALTGELFVDGKSGEFVPPQSSRRFGPLVAVAAATAVLVGGFVLLPGNGGGEAASPDSIEWVEVAARDVVAGPGGFILTHVDLDVLVFTSAGELFQPLEFYGTVAATDDRWLVVGFRPEDGSWTSTDGVNWTRVLAPATDNDLRTGLVAGGGGFLIDDWPERTMWWSEDGSDWTETDPIRSEVGEPVTVIGGDPGFIAFDTSGLSGDDGSRDVLMSSDGVTWSQLDIGADVSDLVRYAAHAAGRWWILAVGVAPTPDTLWSSADGVIWDKDELPWPTHEIGPLRLVSSNDSLLVVLGDLARGRSNGLWSTTDGTSWVEVPAPNTYPWGIAVSQDGSVGLWASPLEVSEGEFPDQVVTTEPATRDPALINDGEISDGLSLQLDILSDGYVTYQELEFLAIELEMCLDRHGVVYDQTFLDGTGLIVLAIDGLDPDTADLADACADAYTNRVREFQPIRGPSELIPAGLNLQYQIIEDSFVTFSEAEGLAVALGLCFTDLDVAATAHFDGAEIVVESDHLLGEEATNYFTCE